MFSTFLPTAPRRAALLASALGATLWLAGCAGLQPKTTEEIVTQRIEARWDALIKRDFEKAWEYTQPSFRALVAQKDYGKRFGGAGTWKGVQVHSVRCEPERCTARLRLTTVMNMRAFRGHELVGYIDEVWVRADGQWWFYQSL